MAGINIVLSSFYVIKDLRLLLLPLNLVNVTRVGVHKFLCVYEITFAIQRRRSSGCPNKITQEVKTLVEQQVTQDDETTASHRHSKAGAYNL